MNTYALGVDAGGSYTRYAVYSDHTLVEEYVGPTIHFMSVGFEGIEKGIRNALTHLSQHYEFEKVIFGLAGYGENQTLRDKIGAQVHSVFPEAILVNDAQLAHIAALKNSDGVFVISGTGSIALRKHNHNTTRTGGFGYLLDDAGSGFWIGSQILKRFTQEVDGRSPQSSIYPTIMDAFEFKSGYDVIQFISSTEHYRQTVASVSGLFKTSQDEVIVKIYQSAGEVLAQCANALLHDQDESVLCSCGGSVLVHNEVVRDQFKSHLDARFEFVFSDYKATDAVLYI